MLVDITLHGVGLCELYREYSVIAIVAYIHFGN